MSKDMDNALMNELREAGIDYAVKEDGRICVDYVSAERTAKMMRDIYVSEIPVGHSDALADPVRLMVVLSLKDMGIPYQEKAENRGQTAIFKNRGQTAI